MEFQLAFSVSNGLWPDPGIPTFCVSAKMTLAGRGNLKIASFEVETDRLIPFFGPTGRSPRLARTLHSISTVSGACKKGTSLSKFNGHSPCSGVA